ncbi:potassium channel family protein [Lachnotalea sp. AF33-28]|jgi:trk system potassium uptake protein TrkA|uniref:potassium channel family protein n=1 Tax=Lachnotalea sp. AF33-28 TaxID=2292046 RepID=UPI000E54DB8B|nr:TrkA family potassium uptake protein [Lachnotalea sp. AF33-28]RHP35035.1 TrkA family potassium uptake protein [Lachnotalea sp. AF33-28]
MARKEFAVFGLGEFGRSVALTLAKNGCEVMAIDSSSEKVQEIADSVTHAVKADATDMDVVRSLGLNNLDAVVIAIGNNLEASIMATIISKECGVPYVLAKASNDIHAAVLRKVGADEIIYPEKAMGVRTARNLMSGNFLDFIELSKSFSMVEITPPPSWVGKSLRELDLRKKGLNVIACKQGDNVITQLDPDTVLREGDDFIIVGQNEALNRIK